MNSDAQNRSRSELPPIAARTFQWALIGSASLLFGVWEFVGHRWLMQLPMNTYHLVSAGGAVFWLAVVTGGIFRLIARHERELQRLNAELAEKNEALRRMEAMRDTRLVALAQDLSLSLAALAVQSRVALQCTTNLADVKAFSSAIDQADKMRAIADELLDLKRGTTASLPSETDRHR
jgi:hypothetical protein